MKSLIFVATVATIEFSIIAWAGATFNASEAGATKCVCIFLLMSGGVSGFTEVHYMYKCLMTLGSATPSQLSFQIELILQ